MIQSVESSTHFACLMIRLTPLVKAAEEVLGANGQATPNPLKELEGTLFFLLLHPHNNSGWQKKSHRDKIKRDPAAAAKNLRIPFLYGYIRYLIHELILV